VIASCETIISVWTTAALPMCNVARSALGMRTAKPMPLTSTTAVVESTAATVPVS
jgi:hypothetical protein